jgi:tRNA modification GTPase
MLVEATLDFPEEEIDFLEKYQARPALQGIQDGLRALIAQARQGMILRTGLHVVLAGQPNVGKSSLLNALAGDDIAIVTPIAGTTRDKVAQQIHIEGVPLHIVDTAGLRDTDDSVESLGIKRSWAEIEKADVILHLQDARRPGDELDQAIVQRLPARTPVLTVYNKIDLLAPGDQAAILSLAQQASQAARSETGMDSAETPASTGTSISAGTAAYSTPSPTQDAASAARLSTLGISAKTGTGLDILRKQLLDLAGWNPGAESPWLARERHLRALQLAAEHVDLAAGHASRNDQALDLFAEELRLAHNELCAITGQFTSDDLLGEIFSSFCIGK